MPAKRLYRSRKNRVIAGVCGGLAEYLDIDPALVRLIVLLLAFANGIGFVFYFVAWLVIPQEPVERRDSALSEETGEGGVQYSVDPHEKRNSRIWVGIILIVTGVIFLMSNYMPWLSWSNLWPLILVAVGIYLIVGNKEEAEE